MRFSRCLFGLRVFGIWFDCLDWLAVVVWFVVTLFWRFGLILVVDGIRLGFKGFGVGVFDSVLGCFWLVFLILIRMVLC